MELTFNFAVGGVFPYEVAGPDAVLLGAGRATSALPVSAVSGHHVSRWSGFSERHERWNEVKPA